MQEYEVRRGHQENIAPDRLRAIMQEVFGNVQERDGKFFSSFGALKELHAWPCKKNALCVETRSDPSVSDEVAQQTIKAYNEFLERTTGFTAKERSRRLQKKAKEGKL
ncbi:MAG: DUF5611 family protein [Thermoplasmata archaeon]